MKILVTAGSTMVPIDKVRSLTNIFKGRTGHEIADAFHGSRKFTWPKNNEVVLLTSNKDANSALGYTRKLFYKTFDDLEKQMGELIQTENFDVIIHSAAVSDYKVENVYNGYKVENVYNGSRLEQNCYVMNIIDNSSKISSDRNEMWLKLVRTPKLIDKIRTEWNFKGILVKFKLQVGISDKELITIAKKSRKESQADIVVANCLEWAKDNAYIIAINMCEKIPRNELAKELVNLCHDMYISRNINSEEFKQEMVNKELESAGLLIQFSKYRIEDMELVKRKHVLANQCDCEVVKMAIEKNESLEITQDNQEDVDIYQKAYEDYWRNKNEK